MKILKRQQSTVFNQTCNIYIYIYIYIYIIRVLVITKSLRGDVSNQVQYTMESARYLG